MMSKRSLVSVVDDDESVHESLPSLFLATKRLTGADDNRRRWPS
jgi:FixJ family two-component response regulator